jgi:SAM-dependent methyltransferase
MARNTELDRYLPPSPRVLDIGGSSGVLAEFIRDEYNAEVVIVEPNAVEADAARAKGFEVYTEVLETANLNPASFDLVVMLRTVDHLIDASAAFAKIRRILRPGGIFLVDGVDYFRRADKVGDAVKPLKIDHCYYFSPETLALMMRKNGLPCLISDLAGESASMVNLAQAGEPEDIAVKGLEMLPGCETRFHEWEQLANRSRRKVIPGHITRSMLAESRWLGHKIFKGTK